MRAENGAIRGFLGAFVALVALWSSESVSGEVGGWRAEWQKTSEAARKEGQLVIYGSADYEKLFSEFHKKYPDIKVRGFLAPFYL